MRARSLFVAGVAGILTFGVPLPATAAPGDTTATVTVTGGALSINVPAAAGSLGTRANTVGGGTISGSLGQVQVNDARSAAACSGWVASVISTAFTPPAGPTIAASAVGYTAGPITKVGTATYAADDPGNLSGVVPAVTGPGSPGTTPQHGTRRSTWPSPAARLPECIPQRSPTQFCRFVQS